MREALRLNVEEQGCVIHSKGMWGGVLWQWSACLLALNHLDKFGSRLGAKRPPGPSSCGIRHGLSLSPRQTD